VTGRWVTGFAHPIFENGREPMGVEVLIGIGFHNIHPAQGMSL
jgi:hypothetical protein